MIEATGLGLRTREGWVFRDVDLTVPAGEVAAVAGKPGSGRTMLLLTLAGRARPTTGELRVGAALKRPAIRGQVAVARATGAVELDDDLTVGDHRRETGLLNRAADVAWAEALVELAVDSATPVGDLAADDRALLAVALAAAGRPAALVVDDVDLRATHAQQQRIWAALGAVAETGITVVASTIDAPSRVPVFELGRADSAAV